MNGRTRDWLRIPAPKPQARARLFCFPYAGAGASALHAWGRCFGPETEAATIQLPGREDRLGEACYRSLDDLVAELANQIPGTSGRPYALFGYSLGALIAFELARQLRRLRLPGPVHLFVAGMPAPHHPPSDPRRPDLPDAEFMEELRRLGGTSEAVLQNTELMRLLIPIFRADFALHDRYRHRAEPPLECPITVFGGEDDEEAKPDYLAGWRAHTRGTFELEILPGDHFFLHRHGQRLADRIAGSIPRAPNEP